MSSRTKNPETSDYPLRAPLLSALAAVGGTKPEPREDRRDVKKNYAQALSNTSATMMADCLRARYRKARVTPSADGSKQELTLGKGLDRKKTDVGVWDDAAGLALGISIKTYTFRDPSGTKVDGYYPVVGRYTKNIKRNDMELRDEAATLHRRQPYAVLVAVMFLPLDACWDAGKEPKGQSSFAHQVFTLRKRTGRQVPDDRADLFEAVYIGLFSEDGAVRFFDVSEAPPRNQPPTNTLSLRQLMSELTDVVSLRNTGFRDEDTPYADPDPNWAIPSGWTPPVGFDRLPPVTLLDALSDTLEDEE